jgi:hypothetical protein
MCNDASSVRLEWSQPGNVSLYSSAWLRQYAYSDVALAAKQKQRVSAAAHSVGSVCYDDITKSEEHVREWLEILNRCVLSLTCGVCLLTKPT